MKSMHKSHVDILDRIDKCYFDIEQDTHNKYKEFIEKWKSQHEFKYLKLKTAFEDVTRQKDELKMWADQNIKELQDKLRELTGQKKQILEDYNNSLDVGEQSSNAAIRAVEHEYVVKMETIKQEYERNLENTKATIPPAIIPVSNKDEVEKYVKEIKDLKKQLALQSAAVIKTTDNQELEKLNKENLELRMVLAELNSVSTSDHTENERIKADNTRLKEEVAQLALLINSQDKPSADSNNIEIENFKRQLDEHQASNSATIAALISERDSYKRELDSIKTTMNTPSESDEPEIQFLKSQLVFLNTELENNRSKISEMEARSAKFEADIEAAEKRHAEAKTELDLSNDRVMQLEAQLAILISKPPKVVSDPKDHKRIADLESEIAKLKVKSKTEAKDKQKIIELEKLVEQLKDNVNHGVSAGIVASSAEDGNLHVEINRKNIELAQAYDEIKTLKMQIDQATAIPAAMIASKPNDDKEKISLRKNLAKAQNHIVLLQEEIEKLKANRADSNQLELVNSELGLAREQIAKLEEKLRQQKQKSNQYPQSAVTGLEVANSPDSNQYELLNGELEQAHKKIADLEEKLRKLKQKAQQASHNLVSGSDPSGNSNEEILALREQIEVLRQENERFATERAALAAPLVVEEIKGKDPAEKLAKAKEKIAQLQAELNSRADPKEVDHLKAHISILEKQIQESSSSNSDQLRSLQDQMADLQSSHSEKIRELEISAKNSNTENQGIIKKLAKEQAILQADKSSIESSLAAALAEIENMNKDVEKLRQVAGQAEEYSKQVIAMTATVKELQEHSKLKEQELKDSLRQRKLLHNQLEDLKGKIRVFCRVRPLNKKELDMDSVNITSIVDEFTINCEAKTGQIKPFMYDSVFGPNSTQVDVFEDTRRLVQSAVDGYNVCIFAYGQTGSGKTFTMTGVPGNPGVTPRAIEELYSILNNLPQHYVWEVKCYMVELYLDNLVDLFCPRELLGNPPQLNIKKDPKGMVIIPEAHQFVVRNPRELMTRFDEGNLNRHTSSTKMNDVSSRSHLVFGVLIDVMNNETQQRTVGKLSLVDLAGSERVSKTEATAERLKEGRAINKSLAALGDVISALSSNESHIPYRNNKLTMLMSDSLGGTAKTLMFVNVSPASYNREETMMSLYYAARVKLITNEPIKNIESKEMSNMKQMIVELSIERDKLKSAFEASGIDRDQIERLANQARQVEEFNDPKFDEL